MPKEPKESQNFDLLSEVQHRAAMQIALGRTGRSVAVELGVNEATLSGWRQTPEFRAAVNRVLADAQEATSNKLRHASGIALDTLIKVMTSPTASDRDKLNACAQVLALTSPTQSNPGHTSAADIRASEERAEREAAAFNAIYGTWP